MKKTKLEKELTMQFANFFSNILPPDIKIVCIFRQITFMREHKFSGKTLVSSPFSIGFNMTIPSNPTRPYSDCSIGNFCKSPDEQWDIIKRDFETFEKLYHLMKTSKPQILAIANACATANHEELVWAQIDNGWDKRGSYTVNGKRVMRNL
jgi:hypothetical protein